MNRQDFQRLSRIRTREAKLLIENGYYAGGYYLAGLAVECGLKACISKNTKRYDFPPKPEKWREMYSHKLIDLVKSAGLAPGRDVEERVNTNFAKSWAVVKDWDVESRYSPSGVGAKDLYRAVAGRNGVMTWLRQHW